MVTLLNLITGVIFTVTTAEAQAYIGVEDIYTM